MTATLLVLGAASGCVVPVGDPQPETVGAQIETVAFCREFEKAARRVDPAIDISVCHTRLTGGPRREVRVVLSDFATWTEAWNIFGDGERVLFELPAALLLEVFLQLDGDPEQYVGVTVAHPAYSDFTVRYPAEVLTDLVTAAREASANDVERLLLSIPDRVDVSSAIPRPTVEAVAERTEAAEGVTATTSTAPKAVETREQVQTSTTTAPSQSSNNDGAQTSAPVASAPALVRDDAANETAVVALEAAERGARGLRTEIANNIAYIDGEISRLHASATSEEDFSSGLFILRMALEARLIPFSGGDETRWRFNLDRSWLDNVDLTGSDPLLVQAVAEMRAYMDALSAYDLDLQAFAPEWDESHLSRSVQTVRDFPVIGEYTVGYHYELSRNIRSQLCQTMTAASASIAPNHAARLDALC